MPEPVLPAPWRMSYIRSLESSPAERSTSGCFLCDAVAKLDDPAQRRERLILWDSPHCVCLLNRYPYTSGHLLIAPKRHVAELDAVDAETLVDLNVQVVRAIALLKKVMRPQGFNLGINMGSAAGAGVPGHLHEHVVPRWAGDVNFMSVVGETKVVPSTTSALWAELAAAL
jgi:ATP adenylyltransferase